MASQTKKVLFGYLIVAAALLIGATADTHKVGDKLGWSIPPGGSIAYKTWAGFQDFEIGHTVGNNNHASYNRICSNNLIKKGCTSTLFLQFLLHSADQSLIYLQIFLQFSNGVTLTT